MMFYKSVTILMLMSQSEACLDLLVRSFNEIFSPVIETSDSRIEESHNVDELTNYYKRDKNGHFVLKDQGWQPSNPYILQNLNPKNSKIRDEHMVKSVFDQLPLTSTAAMESSTVDDPVVGCHSTEAINDPSVTEVPTNCSSSSTAVEPESSSESTIPIYDDNSAGDYLDRENEIDDEYDDYEDEGPRGSYVPGERPLVDMFIKILEMFQLTSKPDFFEH